jgi:putative methyltransferase (TIGR04325 family)
MVEKTAQQMIPVIFIHLRSIPDYMQLSLKQALKYNGRVVLITDVEYVMEGLEVHKADQYMQGVAAFEEAYRHMSTNSEVVERICIVRWFMLRNFMQANGVEVAYYTDSDTMIYDDLTKAYEHYKEYDASYTMPVRQDNYRWTASACCSFWKMKSIAAFCEFVMEQYTRNLSQLREKWSYHLQNHIPGGICDMTLLYLFIPQISFYPLTKVKDGICFDQYMPSAENYEDNEYEFGLDKELGKKVKRIRFSDEQPWYHNLKSGKEVRVIAIAEYAKLLSPPKPEAPQGLLTMARRAAGKVKRKLQKLSAPKPSHGWFGNYTAWEKAAAECTGYDNAVILDTVKSAVLKVKNGQAVYERDSVLFDKVQYSQPLLWALKDSVNNGQLHVVDFGGSLGSSFFQHRKLFSDLKDLRWTVVEQSHFVDAGKKEITGNGLDFSHTIEEALKYQEPQVLLVSSVVQYFEKPYELIDKLQSYGFEYIIVDRTAFIEKAGERITRQVVPPEIYKASYPAWFLNEQKFIGAFLAKYDLLDAFDSAFDAEGRLEDGTRVYRKGFYFKRRKT